MTILIGCSRVVVKTVKVDSFCEGKYKSLWLVEKDFDKLSVVFLSKDYGDTISKYIDYHAINEREFDLCLK